MSVCAHNSVVKLSVTKRVREFAVHLHDISCFINTFYEYTYYILYVYIIYMTAISGSPLISDDVLLLHYLFFYFPSAEIEHEVFL